MPDQMVSLIDRLTRFAPFDLLPDAERAAMADELSEIAAEAGTLLFEEGAVLRGLYVIESGAVDIWSQGNDLVSRRGPGDCMGERGLLREGRAMLTARISEPARLLLLPAARFRHLLDAVPEFARWFARAQPFAEPAPGGAFATGLTALQVSDLMSRDPVSCSPVATATEVARLMRDRVISSTLVVDSGHLVGIVTVHDLANKVLAEGRDGGVPVREIMTDKPLVIAPGATGLDAMITMTENRINHLPVQDAGGKVVGMIGKTDLFRQQAATASRIAVDILAAESPAEMAGVIARLPQLLSHLVAARTRPEAISRRITDLTDAATRRLLRLAEHRFGPPPVPYLWAACGSQGRREQTGVSDQDNCLILDDAATQADDDYFAALAVFVCDGLNEIGFVYCPGDMMATNPRWRQPRRVWRSYFARWIAEPDTEAQMLASVMFDLRPVSGAAHLLDEMQAETLASAKRNSIFVRHMVSNALKHTPPLSLFRGFALIRSGEHKNTLDLKHAGVVPVVDLGRVYALRGAIEAVNTRARIEQAGAEGVVSSVGARDLLDAYDLIAETRLEHQARQIAEGRAPDNFLAPGALSELDRNHLRDAFMVVKTMQSALGQG
ncbi:DUF294 nucleotidyltransferase-like domain-containing protein [Sulfitobacter sp. D35]|uniref:DUF294 nucleotidyltransferase-like domain-containing protein n=1 Tax=Sulfitobacter sp. D35 TaxID=3083252 RepID=UPI00296E47CC|nr:DUF294 nucleotidyltransferase-like domain-containing protein [Sulfitobacter sp. D35]MDW4498821.1 DUF294 nucleotidyltransferase-like domain-containing protein [Sulfitobacter sp. D35]